MHKASSEIQAVEERRPDQDEFNKWSKAFPSLFSGRIGCFNQHAVKLHINKDIQPVQHKLRTVAIPLRQAVAKEIGNMLAQDIIEPVTGPTPWVSAIVPVPKETPGEVRITSDGRVANRAIMRSRYICPTIDDLVVTLNNAKVISKLDLKSGYNQLVIEPSSRYITTFCTHVGLFQYKRLNLGINASSEIFQRVISQLICGIQGAINFSDDIIVHGETQHEHDQRLHELLQRLSGAGLTLNPSKCEFARSELDFYGLHFSAAGMSIQRQKLDALLSAARPKTASEVKSLLGLANYCSRFINNLATIVKPLTALCRPKTPFLWTDEHTAALDALKEALTSQEIAYYDNNWTTIITVDASPVGLGAILSQEDPRDPTNRRVVQYASRTLTEVESRYHQIEKEALAVVWGLEHYHLYIYGRPVEVATNNTVVELVFRKPLSKPKARLENWALRLQRYEFSIRHIPGDSNMADYLSRNPVSTPSRKFDDTEAFVNMLCDTALPPCFSRAELAKSTLEDNELTEVKRMLRGETHRASHHYVTRRNELSVSNDGLLLMANCVVVPTSMRHNIITISHYGHQGSTKTLALMRRHVWFPEMEAMTVEHVRQCRACAANTDTTHKEPFTMSPMPAAPWTDLSVDLYGPLRCGSYLLVLIDEHSRYPVVRKLHTTSAKAVIPILNDIFSLLGIPERLKSDNGPPFNSHQFHVFSLDQGFVHRRITPYWPQANAVCERFMRNLGGVIRKASETQSKWEDALQEFLRSYRATPHSSTKASPNELMFRTSSSTSRVPGISRQQTTQDAAAREALAVDAIAKANMKRHADANQHTQPSDIDVGDWVLLKNTIKNKSTPIFSETRYAVTRRSGNQVTIDDGHGSVYHYNISQVKRAETASCAQRLIRHTLESFQNDPLPASTRRRQPAECAQLPITIEIDDASDEHHDATTTRPITPTPAHTTTSSSSILNTELVINSEPGGPPTAPRRPGLHDQHALPTDIGDIDNTRLIAPLVPLRTATTRSAKKAQTAHSHANSAPHENELSILGAARSERDELTTHVCETLEAESQGARPTCSNRCTHSNEPVECDLPDTSSSDDDDHEAEPSAQLTYGTLRTPRREDFMLSPVAEPHSERHARATSLRRSARTNPDPGFFKSMSTRPYKRKAAPAGPKQFTCDLLLGLAGSEMM